MKLFQRLLVAPAALGLMAPVAAGLAGSANAAELNLDGVNDYAASEEQVTSISQFSDVYPTDWAYQALSNLIERYGCVAGYPDGTYRGGRAMTRFEAAALLNACLDRITEVTDELKRLMKEFEKELAILKGRVDGLEARVGELEATQFSTTTTLEGQASFVIGASSFGGDAREVVEIVDDAGDVIGIERGEKRRDLAAEDFGATTFSYDLQLALTTSFTGKDSLITILRAGNFADSSFGGAGPSSLSTLEVAFQEDAGIDVVGIDRLMYTFPVGESWTVWLGGRIGQEDMLPIWPTAYGSDIASTVLDVTTLPGAVGAYNKNLGAGGGLTWESGGFAIHANYVSANGDVGNPNRGGIATDGAEGTGTVQIGYQGEQWAIAAIYSHLSRGTLIPYGTTFLQENLEFFDARQTDAFGLSAYWQPARSGWIPSISAGWGINSHNYDGSTPDGAVTESQSWSVGLEWDDVFLKGNALGMAVGQPTFATALEGEAITAKDGNYAWEWWYKFQVTDNITVTPALFYLSRPQGQLTTGESFNQLGGLVRTTVAF